MAASKDEALSAANLGPLADLFVAIPDLTDGSDAPGFPGAPPGTQSNLPKVISRSRSLLPVAWKTRVGQVHAADAIARIFKDELILRAENVLYGYQFTIAHVGPRQSSVAGLYVNAD